MRLEAESEFRAALNHLKMRLSESARGKNNGRGASPLKISLEQVEQALKRIEQGTYGICASCSLVMPKSELLMRPYAEICGLCRGRQLRVGVSHLRAA